MKIYIVWMKGKKVTLKTLKAESFTSILCDGLFREVLVKYNLTLDSSTSNICFSHVLFAGTFLVNFLQASHETALIFIVCLILHQFNTLFLHTHRVGAHAPPLPQWLADPRLP